MELTKALAEAGINHTVQVGHHPYGYAPEGETELPAIHCRVDVPWPRYHAKPPIMQPGDPTGPGIPDQIEAVNFVAEEHGFVLESSLMAEGMTLTETRHG